MKTIYGFIREHFPGGVDAVAMDADTKQVISSHFCSSTGFAMSDLGFSEPYMTKIFPSNDQHSTVGFGAERNKKYAELYPDGYELVWIGDPRARGLI